MERSLRSFWLCLLFVSLIMAGCFGGRGTKKGDEPVPPYHAWGVVNTVGGEERGYGLYTYVILDGSTNTRTKAGKRNEALLNAITAPRASEEEAAAGVPVSPASPTRQERNIFYIPLTQPALPDFASALALYNLPLAQQIVMQLVGSMRDNHDLSRQLLYSTPFLVSSPIPLPELQYRPATLLVTDLSSMDDDDMNQVVAAFRQPQPARVYEDLDRYRLIRLSLLGGLLPLNKITIVKTAPADAVPRSGYGY